MWLSARIRIAIGVGIGIVLHMNHSSRLFGDQQEYIYVSACVFAHPKVTQSESEKEKEKELLLA